MRLALYQPDIPQNTGTILRMAACLGLTVDIIGPTGFDMSDRALKRAGLDYLPNATFHLHEDFSSFSALRLKKEGRRLILATTKASTSYVSHQFLRQDIVLLGRESEGVPEPVHEMAEIRLQIPMRAGNRSLNLAVSAAMMMGEALRQLDGFTDVAPQKGT